MTDLNLVPVVTAVLSLEPSLEEGRLRVAFCGTGDMSAISELNDYLKKVHSEAQRLTVSEVTCDLRRLTFMNSSCFKAFITWIDAVKNDARPYHIRLLAEPSLHWQRRSLEALRRLATGVVIVDQGGN
ncbi:MAG TPA: hypothetical protein VGP93_17400 [Polyangiaceae bacterium]|nr:hypothetical protein [Polyangiaceae bacterium]